MIRSASQMQALLSKKVDQVVAAQQPTQKTETSTSTVTTPVVNTQGQLTGTVVNTTA